MSDTPNGDGYAHNFDRRLDRINDTITSLTAAMGEMQRSMFQHHKQMLEQHRLFIEQHQLFMDEMRELRDMQQAQHIDIMALFELNKRTKQRLDKGGL